VEEDAGGLGGRKGDIPTSTSDRMRGARTRQAAYYQADGSWSDRTAHLALSLLVATKRACGRRWINSGAGTRCTRLCRPTRAFDAASRRPHGGFPCISQRPANCGTRRYSEYLVRVAIT